MFIFPIGLEETLAFPWNQQTIKEKINENVYEHSYKRSFI